MSEFDAFGSAKSSGYVHRPKKALYEAQKRDWDRFLADITPQLESMKNSLVETEGMYVDAAREGVAHGEKLSRQQFDTAQQRLGIQSTGRQQEALSRLRALRTGAAEAGTVNDARDSARESNQATATSLANMSTSIRNQGMNALSNSAGMAQSRENAYQQAKASHTQSMISLGSSAMMAMMMM